MSPKTFIHNGVVYIDDLEDDFEVDTEIETAKIDTEIDTEIETVKIDTEIKPTEINIEIESTESYMPENDIDLEIKEIKSTRGYNILPEEFNMSELEQKIIDSSVIYSHLYQPKKESSCAIEINFPNWKDYFIVQNQDGRNYQVFSPCHEFENYMANLPMSKRTYSEVIPGDKPQKNRFDLDFPDSSEKKLSDLFKLECFDKLIHAIIDTFAELYEIGLDTNKIFVYSGNKKPYNRHIIIGGYYVSNNLQARELYKKVIAKLDPKYVKYLVNKKNSKGEDTKFKSILLTHKFTQKLPDWRICGNSKPMVNNFKQLITWQFDEDEINDEYKFSDSVITCIENCEQLEDLDIPKPIRKEKTEAEFIGDLRLFDMLFQRCNVQKRISDTQDWKNLIGVLYGMYGYCTEIVDYVVSYSERYYNNDKSIDLEDSIKEHENILNFYSIIGKQINSSQILDS